MFGIPESTIRLEHKGKGRLVSYFEDWCAIIDALEPCKNIMQNMEILTFERAAKVIEVVTGIHMSVNDVRRVGARIVNIERAFNVREGLTRKDDTLPLRFREEILTQGLSKNTLFEQEPMLDEYYTERGYNVKTGIPTRKTLERLNLDYVADDFIKLGRIRSTAENERCNQ
jgi:aldehyde:ferredoxin oxidoreductase